LVCQKKQQRSLNYELLTNTSVSFLFLFSKNLNGTSIITNGSVSPNAVKKILTRIVRMKGAPDLCATCTAVTIRIGRHLGKWRPFGYVKDSNVSELGRRARRVLVRVKVTAHFFRVPYQND
jgi:hypothetical protein